jgi:hypothetical protein
VPIGQLLLVPKDRLQCSEHSILTDKRLTQYSGLLQRSGRMRPIALILLEFPPLTGNVGSEECRGWFELSCRGEPHFKEWFASVHICTAHQ